LIELRGSSQYQKANEPLDDALNGEGFGGGLGRIRKIGRPPKRWGKKSHGGKGSLVFPVGAVAHAAVQPEKLLLTRRT